MLSLLQLAWTPPPCLGIFEAGRVESGAVEPAHNKREPPPPPHTSCFVWRVGGKGCGYVPSARVTRPPCGFACACSLLLAPPKGGAEHVDSAASRPPPGGEPGRVRPMFMSICVYMPMHMYADMGRTCVCEHGVTRRHDATCPCEHACPRGLECRMKAESGRRMQRDSV